MPALEGALEELHVADVLQLLAVGGKSGVLHLTDGEARGEIFLERGEIVHASASVDENDTRGDEAAYAVAAWTRGSFRFESGAVAPERTITTDYVTILMEAARRSDEWQAIAAKIPSPRYIPEFVVPDNSGTTDAQINLNTREWHILSKIDGRRSIRDIALASGFTTLDAAKSLHGLVATGLLRLREP